MSKILKILILILLVIIAGSIFYIYRTSSRNLNLSLKTPDEVLIGVPFDLRVEFSNQFGAVLKGVFLMVNLPEGAVFVGSGEDKLLKKKDLGDIGEGSLISETYQVVFLRGRDSVKELRATVNYLPSKLGTRFEITEKTEVTVRDAGVAVEVVGPESVLSGEEFELEVIYRNVSEVDFNDLELKLEYPANFSFLRSSIKPDKGKDTWFLGGLRQGSEGVFTIRGSVIGPEESLVEFKTNLKTNLAGKQYDLEIKPFSLTIAPSPLSLNIALNNKSDYIVQPNDNLNYVISYVNNTDAPLRGVIIRAQLVGELFDFNYLNTDAFFRTSDNTLIWNFQNTPALNLLSSNSAGFVKFSIKAKEQYSIRRFSDKNFVLRVNVEIESPTVPGSVNAVRTFNITKLESKVSGTIIVETRGYFRDAATSILNKGPMPPRVGQPTNFTVHWILKNFATDVLAIEIKAALPEGVKFTGVAKSNFASPPFYDEENNQMIWQIDKLSANKGVIDQPVEAIFQIEVIPSDEQVGNYMLLVGETSFRVFDDFTNIELSGFASAVTTSLPHDVTIGAQGGVVQP